MNQVDFELDIPISPAYSPPFALIYNTVIPTVQRMLIEVKLRGGAGHTREHGTVGVQSALLET